MINTAGKQPEHQIENFMFQRDSNNPAYKTNDGPINVSVSRVNSIVFDDTNVHVGDGPGDSSDLQIGKSFTA